MKSSEDYGNFFIHQNMFNDSLVLSANYLGQELSPNESDCKAYHDLTNATFQDICQFINSTAACQPDGEFINYLKFIYCSLSDSAHPSLWPLLFAVVLVWLLFLLNGLAIAADSFLCPALHCIHSQLGLSENLVGVTFVAFGNGAPDIFAATAAIGGRRPDAGLAFGALFGAGIFVTTVVVGAITVIKPFHPMERPLLRDIIFYLATVAWAYSILYRSRVGLADAVGFIGLYFFYALIVVVGRHLNTFLRRRKSRCLRRSSVVSVLPPVMGSSDDDNEAGGGAHDVSPNGGGWETGLDDSFPPAVTTLEPCNLHGHDLCCHDRPPLLISTDSNDIPILIPNVVAAVSQAANAESSVLVGSSVNDDVPLLNDGDDVTVVAPSSNHLSCRPHSLPAGGDSTTVDHYSAFISLQNIFCFLFGRWEWTDLNFLQKFLQVFGAPLWCLLSLSVPVVEYDEASGRLTGLCFAAYLTNFCVMPVAIVVLLGMPLQLVASQLPAVMVALVVASIVFALLLAADHLDLLRDNVVATFPFFGFGMSVLWIYTLANEIVGVLHSSGIVLNINDASLGLTVLAWGNSIGDLVTNAALARADKSRMALSACFAAPLFNTLLGFGIPFTMVLVEQDAGLQFSRSSINAILLLTLCVSLLFSLFWMVLSRFQVGVAYGVVLFLLYFAFLGVALSQEFNLIDLHLEVIFDPFWKT